MVNAIDQSCFFIDRQMEILGNITLSKKASYILAPMLPISSFVIFSYLFIVTSWLFVFFMIASLFVAYRLTVASINLLSGQNTFVVSNTLHILRRSIRRCNVDVDKEAHAFFKSRKFLEIRLQDVKTSKKAESTFKIKSFSKAKLNLIENSYSFLTDLYLAEEIISPESTLQDFINVIRQASSKDKKTKGSILKLNLQSDQCYVFLENMFIPLVNKITGVKVTPKWICHLFYYHKSNKYKPLNYDSITKSDRKKSTNIQKAKYNNVLDLINKSVL
ncbi:hypothetical protein FHR24_000866 [Wenyingzhuangia heitensis]|uniref:Uncharacterized protein n=1 Tax=Wenyingzhuangia heitensis TaxID=1487859 RepID=A0ABX0U6K3_9FLAO|nr:hypothetical protein [Wenyingzhuangia heitensis]NIJ44427.1 hypothetical protein [Wenyingzhuangia heitensis]